MTAVFDLLVVGAGPGGLMAAQAAAELGLRVCLVERRHDISEVRRACCAQFIMDDGYENEALEVGDGRLRFPRNGFEIPYTGRTVDVVNKYYFSPAGHRMHFAHDDGKPLAIKFDKDALLAQMAEQCARRGVAIESGLLAHGVKDDADGVHLDVVRNERRSTIRGKKLVLAEGVNARLSGILGLNEDRKLLTTAQVVKHYVEGYAGYEPGSWNLYYGRAYHSNAAVFVGPSLSDDVIELTLVGTSKLPPQKIYRGLTTDSPLAHRFRGARIVDTHCCSARAFTPMKRPHRGNALAIGDTAAYVETEVQGAILCGHHAATAVKRELEGEPGFDDYTRWWLESFEFNGDDFLRVAQGYALVPTYTDAELDHLFGLVEDRVFEGSYSQYKTPKLMWDAFLEHRAAIRDTNPTLYEKIERMDQMTLSTTF
jgi:flavin-dependent dehydrogenase